MSEKEMSCGEFEQILITKNYYNTITIYGDIFLIP